MDEIKKREQETDKGRTIRKFKQSKRYKNNFDRIFNNTGPCVNCEKPRSDDFYDAKHCCYQCFVEAKEGWDG